MAISKKELLLFDIAVISIMLLTLVRDIMGVSINQFLLLGIISFFLVVLKKQQCINYTFFLLPLLSGIQGFSVTVACIVLILKAKRVNYLSLVFFLIIVIMEILNNISTGYADSSFTKLLLLYSSNILLFFYLLYYDDKDFDCITPIKFFLVGATFVMLVILYRSITGAGFEDISLETTRIGGRAVYEEINENGTEFQMNPNSLAFYSIYTMTVLLSFNKQLKFPLWAFLIILATSTLAGVFSFSRTWLICIILYLVISVFTNRGNKEILLTVFVAIITFYLFRDFITSVLDSFSTRFNEEAISFAGGRTDIFKAYHEWMLENNKVLTGIGIIYYQVITSLGHASHSGIQQIFIGYGIIGLVLFIVAAIVYTKRFINNKSIALFLPFTICLIFDQSIQFLSNPILLFPFLMLAYTLRLDSAKSFEESVK